MERNSIWNVILVRASIIQEDQHANIMAKWSIASHTLPRAVELPEKYWLKSLPILIPLSSSRVYLVRRGISIAAGIIVIPSMIIGDRGGGGGGVNRRPCRSSEDARVVMPRARSPPPPFPIPRTTPHHSFRSSIFKRYLFRGKPRENQHHMRWATATGGGGGGRGVDSMMACARSPPPRCAWRRGASG